MDPARSLTPLRAPCNYNTQFQEPVLSIKKIQIGHVFDLKMLTIRHVAINKVIACDMKSVPLPEEAIDIAVFSLSLMGRNWSDYIAEAKRCLATGGYLLIAETTKSIKGRLSGIRDLIKKQGFEIYVDEERGDFTFIEAREL